MATRLRDAGGTLLELDSELRRLTRRADRQQRRMRQSAGAWQLWSSTIDDGLDIVGRIDDASALDVDALAIKFRAIFWRMRVDEDLIMDETVTRALHKFGGSSRAWLAEGQIIRNGPRFLSGVNGKPPKIDGGAQLPRC